MANKDEDFYVNERLKEKFSTGVKSQPKKTKQKSKKVRPKKIANDTNTSTASELPTTITTPKKPKVKEGNNRIRLTIIWGSIVVAFFLFMPVYNFVSYQYSDFTVDSKVKDIANNSGFSYEGKRQFYKTSPELVTADALNEKCPFDATKGNEYGCFLPKDNKMYLLEVADDNYKDIEYTTAAHETLHAIWDKLDDNTKITIASEIQNQYKDKSNPEISKLTETMKLYETDEATVTDELHSFMGSSVSALNQPLENHFAKYFNNRWAAVNAEVAFDNKIDEGARTLDAKYAELNAESDRIDNYRVQWLDSIEVYINRARYNGDSYSEGKNVDAYNSNLVNYNQMIESFNSNRAAYNAEVDKYNILLQSFRPSTAPLPVSQ